MPLIGRDNVSLALANIKPALNKKLRKIIFKGFRNIIKGTPVDKGRARSNWFATQNAPSNSTTDNRVGNATPDLPIDVLSGKIYFTNNLPYVGTLEYGGYSQPGTDKTSGGFSIQAPVGWVRAEVIRMKNDIRKL